MTPTYDVIIIGAGPAGLAAGLYVGRAKLNTLIIERESMGGELMNRELIENYPGYPEGVQGPELGSNMVTQAIKYGAEIHLDDIREVEWRKGFKLVRTDTDEFLCRALIIANGAHPRPLGVTGEPDFANRGVFYCATCDGPSFADKTVVVAGGGDSGLTEALMMARYVSRVVVVEVMPRLGATRTLQDRVFAEPKIETRCGVKIEAILGLANEHVGAVEISETATGKRSTVATDGVLVRVGLEANTDYLRGRLSLDVRGQVMVNENLETSVSGVFAAGDIRHNSPMQISTAVGDGAAAALSACRFLGTR